MKIGLGRLDLVLQAGIGLFAMAVTAYCGSRGFFAFDQSIVFDGGYRVFLGQVPYKDFLIPVGPMPFVLQAIAFRLAGEVSYTAYLAHAAVGNAIAALLAMACLRTFFPQARLAALGCGLITSVWFYPPFGTPWLEQTAFLFHLAALFSVARGLRSPSPSPKAPFVLAGSWVVLAFLSKQNAGLLSGASLLAILAFASRRRTDLQWFLVGGVACAAVFAAWLFAFSDPAAFVQAFWAVPSAEGWRRLSDSEFHSALLSQIVPTSLVPAISLAALVGAAALLILLAKTKETDRELEDARQALWVSLTLVMFQVGFIGNTYNAPENAFGFCGLAALLPVCATERLLEKRGLSPVFRSVAGPLATALLVLPMTLAGWDVSSSRAVHDFWWPIQFRRPEISVALFPVRWGVRTGQVGEERAVRVGDLDSVAAFLSQTGREFFVFPDSTVLYGLAGRVPPQPLLWFHRGLTYSTSSAHDLDQRIVDALRTHDVRHVVYETVTLRGAEKTLRDFPLLKKYIDSEFVPIRRFGIFEIRER